MTKLDQIKSEFQINVIESLDGPEEVDTSNAQDEVEIKK